MWIGAEDWELPDDVEFGRLGDGVED